MLNSEPKAPRPAPNNPHKRPVLDTDPRPLYHRSPSQRSQSFHEYAPGSHSASIESIARPPPQSPYQPSPSSAQSTGGQYPFPTPHTPHTPQASNSAFPPHPSTPQGVAPQSPYLSHRPSAQFSPLTRENYPPAHHNNSYPPHLSISPQHTPSSSISQPSPGVRESPIHAQTGHYMPQQGSLPPTPLGPPLQRSSTLPVNPNSQGYAPQTLQASRSPSISSRSGPYASLHQSPIIEHERFEKDRVQTLSKRDRTASISPKTTATLPSQESNSLGSRTEMDIGLRTELSTNSRELQANGFASNRTNGTTIHPDLDRMSLDSPIAVASRSRSAHSSIAAAETEATLSRPVNDNLPERFLSKESPVGTITQRSPMLENHNAIAVPRKRRRYDEPPIYARSIHAVRVAPAADRPPPPGMSSSMQVDSQRSTLDPPKENGGTLTPEPNGPQRLSAQPLDPSEVSSSRFEPSITNKIPYEELTKLVADFLFTEVVLRDDVAEVPGATLEIEAKVGVLIDKHTDQRVRLPVLTESVLADDVKAKFTSSMTLSQHKATNDFLNKALIESQLPPSTKPGGQSSIPRVKMEYVHTYETDTFYELPDGPTVHARLPPSVRSAVDPRRGIKARVTTDQKTGKVLAKIIKLRIRDLHIISPRTLVDWRISINLEMDYDGDLSNLGKQRIETGSDIARNKNRLSYKHQSYQIDLTQVTPFEVCFGKLPEVIILTMKQNSGDMTHELEVEVSSADLIKHGKLAQAGHANKYEDIVKGFLDNVRLLARAIPPPQ
jgi:hypothetical protein